MAGTIPGFTPGRVAALRSAAVAESDRPIFDGVRIVEAATRIAAPFATMLLADHGAEVVKLEPPGGDPYRSEPGFQTFNRGKHSIVVDDPYDETCPWFTDADVVVVDRPGAAARIKLAHPGAIVIAVPPWGERGPKVHDPASPDLLAAACGMMWNQQSYAEVPVHLVAPLVPYGTAALAALAIAAALYARAARGVVAHYEVSEVAGAAAMQIGEFYEGEVPAERPGYSPLGSKGRVPIYRLLQASDGRWLFVACGTRRFFERLCKVIGRTDLVDHELLPNPPWGLLDHDAVEFITPILETEFATRTRDEWIIALRSEDIPVQPVLTREEFLTTSVASANRLVVEVAHPELGLVRTINTPLVLDAAPGLVSTPAPRLGQSGDLIEHSVPPESAGPATAPLAGVRVVDLASFIAGPVISRHLAMLGAEVVKVEPPSGDPFRAIGPLFCGWNQGKQSVVIDLQTAEGRDLVAGLVTDADVIIENFRPGVAERLGVDAGRLRSINSDVVLLSSPGYGADAEMASVPAFDPLLQSLGGMMAAQGGDDEPVFLTVAVHDVMTPLLGAFGSVAALYDRLRTGRSQHVHTSLAQSTAALQAAELTRYDGAPEPPVGGFDYPGPDPGGRRGVRLGESGWEYVDGDHVVPVATRGLSAEAIAVENGLVSVQDHPGYGRHGGFGQLVVGAGPPPGPSPALDEHGEEIRARLQGRAVPSVG